MAQIEDVKELEINLDTIPIKIFAYWYALNGKKILFKSWDVGVDRVKAIDTFNSIYKELVIKQNKND